MREINVIFEIEKSSQGGRNVVGRFFTYVDGGRTVVPTTFYGWRGKIAEAEALARKATLNVYDAADWDNARFDRVASYLNARKARAARPAAQLELL